MPLVKLNIADDLVTFRHGGAEACLNRQRYEDLRFVTGEPSLAHVNPDRSAAVREAFAALQIVQRRAASGANQFVYLGDEAVHYLYGRAKQNNEQDCDVVARLLKGQQYGYCLAEGKGADVLKAVAQFEAARLRLETRPIDAGPVLAALVVMPRLRYLEWNQRRNQWVAYTDGVEDRIITNRLLPNVEQAAQRRRPALHPSKRYLIDGPEDDEMRLPSWAINNEQQPFTVWAHDRTGSSQYGSFRPVLIGTGPLQIYYVNT
jgi:hypothetical protein